LPVPSSTGDRSCESSGRSLGRFAPASDTARRAHAALYAATEHALAAKIALLAEIDGAPAGFVMARVDYGEFGRTADEAVMEAIG